MKSVVFLYISFRAKIVGLFAAFYLFLTLTVFYFYDHQSDSRILYQIRDADLRTAEIVSASLDNFFNMVEQTGWVLANNPDLISFLETACQVPIGEKTKYREYDLTNLVQELKNSAVEDLCFLDRDGYVIVGTPVYKDRMDLIFGPTQVKDLSQDSVNWLDMFRIQSQSTEQVHCVIPCTIPVYTNGDNRFLGHLVLYVNEASIYKNISAYEDRIFILDDQNLIISFAQKDYLLKDFYSKMSLGYYADLSTDISAVLEPENTVLTMRYYERMNWQLVIRSDSNSLYAKENFDRSFFVAVLSICAVSLPLMLILLVYYVLRPISQLQNTIRKVDEGDLSLRNSYNRKDEFGLLSTCFNHLLDTVQNLMGQIAVEEKRNQNYRLQLIQSQIKPHFLYNVLELISSFIRLDMKDTALMTVQSISNFYRISLSDGVDIIKVEDEINLVKQYLFLQEMRYREFMEFETDFEEAIFPYTIPKLSLQTLVENAIYHGLRDCGYMGKMKVRGYLEDGMVCFEVLDNGVGFPPKKIEEVLNRTDQGNFGISSVVFRCRSYFEQNVVLKIEPRQPGTKVILKVPCKLP